jgi:hypothetical protein
MLVKDGCEFYMIFTVPADPIEGQAGYLGRPLQIANARLGLLFLPHCTCFPPAMPYIEFTNGANGTLVGSGNTEVSVVG